MAKKEHLEIERQEHIAENVAAKRVGVYGFDLDALEWRRLAVNADGEAVQSVFDRFKLNDFQEGADTYLGFTQKDGQWYILKINEAAGTFRYARGSSNYSTNWTNRTSLTYDYFHNVF